MTTEETVIRQQSQLLKAFQSENEIMHRDLNQKQEHIEKLVGVLIACCIEYGKGKQIRLPKSTMKRVHPGLRMNIGVDKVSEDLVVTLREVVPDAPKSTKIIENKLRVVDPDENVEEPKIITDGVVQSPTPEEKG